MAKTLSPIVVSIAAKMMLKTISGNRLISAADLNKLSVTNIKRIFFKISQIVFSSLRHFVEPRLGVSFVSTVLVGLSLYDLLLQGFLLRIFRQSLLSFD